MSQTELTKLLKDTWKALAIADQQDWEALLTIIKDVLGKLEAFEVE